MNEPAPVGKSSTLQLAGVLARWVTGALFVYMGWSKAFRPEAFLKLAREYDLVTSPILLNSIAVALPWFEAFCGVLLLAGVAVRGTALLVLAMLLPFTTIVWLRALAIADVQHKAFCAVKFDCGCGMGEVFICYKLLENGLLILVSCWLLTGAGRRFCARYGLVVPPGGRIRS